MKVIVAGSEGLIGQSVVAAFERRSHETLRLDLALGHDLTDEAFVREWFRDHQADYLVNLFAQNDHVIEGAEAGETLFDVSLDSLRRYLEVNVTALFSVCREFARHTTSGGIVNVSSTYGVVSPRPEMYGDRQKHIGYSVSKGGVIQLTRHLATHFAPAVRVNCVVPGGVRHTQPPAFQDEYARHTPMGRMMRVDELNGLLAFLCSEDSSYMTGAVLAVDGGWTAW